MIMENIKNIKKNELVEINEEFEEKVNFLNEEL